MKNPVLNVNTFLANTGDISFLMLNSDELSFIDNPFVLEEYKYSTKITSSIEKKDPYRPHKTRGVKAEKEGLCLECNKWFKLKNSSYWYHMNFKHGISSKGIKYPEPEIRKNNGIFEGFCNLCDEWVPLGLIKYEKNWKFNWYRHCQKVHKT